MPISCFRPSGEQPKEYGIHQTTIFLYIFELNLTLLIFFSAFKQTNHLNTLPIAGKSLMCMVTIGAIIWKLTTKIRFYDVDVLNISKFRYFKLVTKLVVFLSPDSGKPLFNPVIFVHSMLSQMPEPPLKSCLKTGSTALIVLFVLLNVFLVQLQLHQIIDNKFYIFVVKFYFYFSFF